MNIIVISMCIAPGRGAGEPLVSFFFSESFFFLTFISNINTTFKQFLIHNYTHIYIREKNKHTKNNIYFFQQLLVFLLREQERERVDRQKIMSEKQQQHIINFSIIKRL